MITITIVNTIIRDSHPGLIIPIATISPLTPTIHFILTMTKFRASTGPAITPVSVADIKRGIATHATPPRADSGGRGAEAGRTPGGVPTRPAAATSADTWGMTGRGGLATALASTCRLSSTRPHNRSAIAVNRLG